MPSTAQAHPLAHWLYLLWGITPTLHLDSGAERPSLVGITGTNGKTSTTYILDGILRQLGRTTGLTSTAERHIAGEVIVSRLTTPESTEMPTSAACSAAASLMPSPRKPVTWPLARSARSSTRCCRPTTARRATPARARCCWGRRSR